MFQVFQATGFGLWVLGFQRPVCLCMAGANDGSDDAEAWLHELLRYNREAIPSPFPNLQFYIMTVREELFKYV